MLMHWPPRIRTGLPDRTFRSRTSPGAIFDDRLKYEAWQREYDTARNAAKYLPDLREVDKAVSGHPERKLMLLDTDNGRQGRAAIAVGDPDTATHVSVTTPGLNTTVHGAIGAMTSEATNLQRHALSQLSLVPGHEHDTVSAIAWIGYDPPQVPGKGCSRQARRHRHPDDARSARQSRCRVLRSCTAFHQTGLPGEFGDFELYRMPAACGKALGVGGLRSAGAG